MSGERSELERERAWASELQATLDALMDGLTIYVAANETDFPDREVRRKLLDLVDQANESRVDAVRRYEGWERTYMPGDPRASRSSGEGGADG